MTREGPGLTERLRRDGLASVVVFLVALPLCMGIAIASGTPPATGIVTGIIGGILVGALTGSPMQVSGPAAGLAVIVFDLVNKHGIAALGPIVLLGGMIQMAASAFRLGQWFRAVSPAVIHGMLAGIGVLIAAAQFHVMVDATPKASGLGNLAAIPASLVKGVPLRGFDALGRHEWAAMVGLLTVVTTATWSKFRPPRLRFMPGPLLGIVAASTLAQLLGLDVDYVRVPHSLSDDLTWLSAGAFRILPWNDLLVESFAVAFIASAETLLCATAVDQMHTGPRTRYDRELGAQGLGNVLCGILGALPMTGVIVRSSANVEAGAETRASTMLHGLWILLLVGLAPQLLAMVPRASLAAVLVYIGYKLARH